MNKDIEKLFREKLFAKDEGLRTLENRCFQAKEELRELFGGKNYIECKIDEHQFFISESSKQKQWLLKRQGERLYTIYSFKVIKFLCFALLDFFRYDFFDPAELEAGYTNKDRYIFINNRDFKLSKGMKIGKAVRETLTLTQIHKNQVILPLDQNNAYIGDYLDLSFVEDFVTAFGSSCYKIPKDTIIRISIDINDIAVPSEFTTSDFTSCFSIGNCCECAPFAIANDSRTAIAIAYRKKTEEGTPLKFWRQWIVFSDDLKSALFLKAYPDENLIIESIVRKVVGHMIAEFFGFSLWWKVESDRGFDKNIRIPTSRKHHRVYGDPAASRIWFEEKPELTVYSMGSDYTCLGCGRETDSEHMSCLTCEENILICRDCQERFRPEDLLEIQWGEYVCQSCLEEEYEVCVCCEEYHYRRNMYKIQGEWVCERCFDEMYMCDRCGTYVFSNSIVLVENRYIYCIDCADIHCFVCPKCGEYYRKKVGMKIGEELYCQNCYTEFWALKEEEEE